MTHKPLRLVVAAVSEPDVAVANETDTSQSLTCPLCHTPAPLSRSAVEAGGTWQCTRCRQPWDAARLTAVAAYAVWNAERKAGRSAARREWSYQPAE